MARGGSPVFPWSRTVNAPMTAQPGEGRDGRRPHGIGALPEPTPLLAVGLRGGPPQARPGGVQTSVDAQSRTSTATTWFRSMQVTSVCETL